MRMPFMRFYLLINRHRARIRTIAASSRLCGLLDEAQGALRSLSYTSVARVSWMALDKRLWSGILHPHIPVLEFGRYFAPMVSRSHNPQSRDQDMAARVPASRKEIIHTLGGKEALFYSYPRRFCVVACRGTLEKRIVGLALGWRDGMQSAGTMTSVDSCGVFQHQPAIRMIKLADLFYSYGNCGG